MELVDVVGIGPKTVLELSKLDINNSIDLLYYYPKRYNIIKRSNMDMVNNGDKVIIDGIVEGQPTMIHLSNNRKNIIFRISNNRGIYNISAFNQVYLCKELRYGMKVIVFGKYDKYRNTIVVSEVRFGELPKEVSIEPVYYTREGVSKKLIARSIDFVLANEFEVPDYVPDYLSIKYNFLSKWEAFCNIHHPKGGLEYKRALQRLKYEELFLYLLRINYMRLCSDSDSVVGKKFDVRKVKKFIDGLPYSLTSDQDKVIEDILDDMKSNKHMNRLIQGDVGSGKTIVAMVSAYANFLAGYQTALMVPTGILANQHYQDAIRLFDGMGVRIGLLTSGVKNKEKKELIKKISNGEIDFIIGTQSLIQEGVSYYNLGLIITDEQHRFGVNQRSNLKNKGVVPDVLSMSATPIPRTYALTIYGDMDVSNIKTKPALRKDVITILKKEKDITSVLELMRKEIDNGHQIYVIAPSIEESDSLDNVNRLKEKMELAFGKIAKIGVVHGKLDSDVKNKEMSDFDLGKIDILISTTVIEVGVNVPNASMIVIFNANLFGLSTLHQLRGRVGRGSIQSYCVLVAKDFSERLKVLEETNDGFVVSEYDFKMRGEGDLFGIRQSGDVLLKLANVRRDYDLLLRVREDVLEFLDSYYGSDKYRDLFLYLDKFRNLD